MRIKQPDELTFSDDIAFCNVLERNPDLCREMLEVLLEMNIIEVRLQQQKAVQPEVCGHGVRFDVYAEDENHTRYDIEMQAVRNRNLPKRSRYYQGAMDMQTLEKGMDYTKLPRTIIIFICSFDPFYGGMPIYRFRYQDVMEMDTELDDGTERIFVNAASTRPATSERMGSLLHYISTGEITSELTNRLEKALDRVKNDEDWRKDYMTYAMKLFEEREEGRREGLEQGIEQGIEQGTRNTILELLTQAIISAQVACDKLGISLEDVRKLTEEYSMQRAES